MSQKGGDMEPQPIFNCHGVLVGHLCKNEHGGSFFVLSRHAQPGERVNHGINDAAMREAFRNSQPSTLRRAFG